MKDILQASKEIGRLRKEIVNLFRLISNRIGKKELSDFKNDEIILFYYSLIKTKQKQILVLKKEHNIGDFSFYNLSWYDTFILEELEHVVQKE